jgi:hypothetical protein
VSGKSFQLPRPEHGHDNKTRRGDQGPCHVRLCIELSHPAPTGPAPRRTNHASSHGSTGAPVRLFGKALSCRRCSIGAADHRPKPVRMSPRKAFSSCIPTSVSMRFPDASKNTNVVFPTPWRLANAWPSGVLRSARTNATCPRNSGRSASTTRLSWAQFGQPGKNTCTMAGCLPMTSKPL